MNKISTKLLNIQILITTCKHYYNTSIPVILKDIEKYDIPRENIIIVSGQEDVNEEIIKNKIKVIKVKYSGLHLTGLIHIYENKHLYEDVDYWVNLPCTIKFGEKFYKNITDLLTKYHYFGNLKTGIDCIPFINPRIRPTMDMGILTTEHIMNMGNYLLKTKLTLPYTINNIKEMKRTLIFNENSIFGISCKNKKFSEKIIDFKFLLKNQKNIRRSFLINNKKDLIEEDQMIRDKLCNVVYLKPIDLYKYQRNYNKTTEYPFDNIVLNID